MTLVLRYIEHSLANGFNRTISNGVTVLGGGGKCAGGEVLILGATWGELYLGSTLASVGLVLVVGLRSNPSSDCKTFLSLFSVLLGIWHKYFKTTIVFFEILMCQKQLNNRKKIEWLLLRHQGE
ncbi:hypothetical protein BY996DRAFT_6413480 [Phakopsora pachyrhizi]|nr:hypothetical protein BY996DRAFT_6413480 [Phakopsora pachyrhizi]